MKEARSSVELHILNMFELNKKIDTFLEKANQPFVLPKKFKYIEHDNGLFVTNEQSEIRIVKGVRISITNAIHIKQIIDFRFCDYWIDVDLSNFLFLWMDHTPD